jgi:hypothetical protein
MLTDRINRLRTPNRYVRRASHIGLLALICVMVGFGTNMPPATAYTLALIASAWTSIYVTVVVCRLCNWD